VPATTLSEAASKQLVGAHGVPVPVEHVVVSPDEAAQAAERIGFPVAVKLCGDAIAHKTERGLVRLGVGTADAVRTAAAELLAAATPEDGTVGVLVAPMVRGTRELIAGLHLDPRFGMTVMLGVGGVLAEAVADVVFRLVPIDRLDAAEMIDDLRTQALLGPFRGEPPVDREQLVDVLKGLSDLAAARPDVVSVDLNPLIVAAGVPVAADALVVLDGGATV
jgi:acetyl-CoA synthetase (ADP-forming)